MNAAEPKQGGKPCRILVIEDNTGDLYLIRQAFLSAGIDCEIVTFSDGEKALRYVQEIANTEDMPKPDLVLLDLHLPKLDSTDILRTMRESRFMAKTPVVVLSSSISQWEHDRLAAYTVARHLEKPVGLDEFLLIGEKVREVMQEGL